MHVNSNSERHIYEDGVRSMLLVQSLCNNSRRFYFQQVGNDHIISNSFDFPTELFKEIREGTRELIFE